MYTTYPLPYITYGNMTEPTMLLYKLKKQLFTYGYVTVADYYDLLNRRCGHLMCKYGWTDLHDACAKFDGVGYFIDLPRPRPLYNVCNRKDETAMPYCFNVNYTHEDTQTYKNDNPSYTITVASYNTMAEPECILKNGPATIVFWKDGTKTIVKRKKGEKEDPYYAFTAALAKKIYGNNSRIKGILESKTIDETKKYKNGAKK